MPGSVVAPDPLHALFPVRFQIPVVQKSAYSRDQSAGSSNNFLNIPLTGQGHKNGP